MRIGRLIESEPDVLDGTRLSEVGRFTAKREGPQGLEWEVILIQAGLSANMKLYPEEVLREAAPIFDGVRAFADHATETERFERPERSVEDVVGWFESPRFEDGAIRATFKFSPAADRLRTLMTDAWDRNKPDLVGLSIDAIGETEETITDQGVVLEVKRIIKVFSVDVVTDPAAGGALLRLVAANRPDNRAMASGQKETETVKKKLLELLKRAAPKAYAGISENATAAEIAKALKEASASVNDEALKGDIAKALKEAETQPAGGGDPPAGNTPSGGPPAGDPEKTPAGDPPPEKPENKPPEDPAGSPAGGGENQPATESIRGAGSEHNGHERLTETERRLSAAERNSSQMLLETRMAGCNLSLPIQAAIRRDFGGRVFQEKDLDARIEADRKTWAAVIQEASNVSGLGVEFGEEEADKYGHALDGFFANHDIGGVSRFRSFKEAYRKTTGRWAGPDEILVESYPAHMGERTSRSPRLREAALQRLSESLTTASWAQLLGDSVRRRMIAEYGLPGLDDWRKIVSDPTSVADFRTMHRMRMGGYGTLPAVAQSGTYQSLTSPTDEEVTYSATKRGGTDDLTFEMIANDDVGSIRRIPQKLGRSAAITLYRFVFDFIKDNPTMDYDSVALFHATHGNLGSTALSSSELDAARTAMRSQAAFGAATEILGIVPKLLLVPNELEHLAWRLVSSQRFVSANEDATTPNLHQALEIMVIDYWTDANDWAVIGDPNLVPTIEIGFFEGREEPEIFVQDMPNVGSMFDADKITYKIRHIYGGDVLEHRGMWKAVVA